MERESVDSEPIEILDRPPTLDEYLDLARAVGWSEYVTPDTARRALAGSLFATVAARRGRFVGLFSATGKAPFYRRYGFASAGEERPGMSQYLRART